MIKEKNPKIRLNEFTEDWEQCKFSDVVQLRRGLTYKPTDVQDTGVRVLRSSNINEDTFVYGDDDVFVNPNAVNIEKAKPNDILITSANGSSRLVGKHALIKEIANDSAVHGGFMLLGRTNNYDFINASMSSSWYTKFINTYVAGGNGAIGNLSKSDLDEQLILIPSDLEQKKIGECFSTLDNLITLQQRKHEKIKNVKQAMLKKMFPKKGEKFPEIRFKGFTEAWEQRKLGELAEFNPKCELPDFFEYVDLESVVGTVMISHRTVEKKLAPSRAQRLAAKGDLFYQTVRPYQRNNYFFDKNEINYVFSTGYAQLRPHDDGYFLLSLVQTDNFVKEVLDNCTGTSYPAINSNDLSKIIVTTSSNSAEQKKIGAFFRELENHITLQQRKLDYLKNIKKSLLQKMFP